MLEKITKGIGIAIIALVIAVVAVIGAYPTKWAVNYLLTPTVLAVLFGGPLSFWKALVLNFVAGWLFRSSSVEKK